MIFYLSVDAPPLGVEVEEVVGALLLAARLEDGPNFGKLICLGYVVVLVVVALKGANYCKFNSHHFWHEKPNQILGALTSIWEYFLEQRQIDLEKGTCSFAGLNLIHHIFY